MKNICVCVFVHMYVRALTHMGWPWRPGGPAVWVAQLSPGQSGSQTARSYSPPLPDKQTQKHTQRHTVKSIFTTKAHIISTRHSVISRSVFFIYILKKAFVISLSPSVWSLPGWPGCLQGPPEWESYMQKEERCHYFTVLSTIAMT